MQIIISHDAPPSIGGAHTWLYQVYKRWPTPVQFLTEIPLTRDFAGIAEFDSQPHGSLTFLRTLRAVGDISLLRPGFLSALAGNRKTVRQTISQQPAVLHCLRAFPEGITAIAAHLGPAPAPRIITYAHGEEILVARSSRQLSALTGVVYRHSDMVIANSENTRSLVLGIAPSAKTAVIHPGVNWAQYQFSTEDRRVARLTLGLPSDGIALCTVARMEPRKNQRAVIEALAALALSGRRYHYICAGDGPERSALEDLAHQKSLQDYIKFPGRISEHDKFHIFAAADIHVMPSIQTGDMLEGFGIVFIEASAAGIPSIAGDSGGQREAVRDGRTGRVVDGRNISALASAIDDLARDPSKRRALGAEARKFARSHDWSAIKQSTLDTVAGVLRN